MSQTLEIHGILVSTGEEVDLWVADSIVSFSPIPGVSRVITGWIMPGLVDAHCHVGLAQEGGVDRVSAEAQARADLASGVTLIRDAGAPIDTHWLDGVPGMPRIIRAGRHIARPKRYIRGFAVEVEPEELLDEVRSQARAGDGWVKLVGDWIDRDLGDLACLWPEDLARAAILAAHEEGARVTAHCFGEDSVNQLVNAGIDCIEHGCGLDEETISVMANRGVTLVPTLDNLRIFPGIADQAEDRFPRYAAHMRHLYDRRTWVVRKAIEEGVPIIAGTDAGGTRAHGTIVDEVRALAGVVGTDVALGAVSWRAREWLDAPGIAEGTSVDLVVLPTDPRESIDALDRLEVLFA